MNKFKFLKSTLVVTALLLQAPMAWSMAKRLPASEPEVTTPAPAPTTPPPVSSVDPLAEVQPLWETKVSDGKAWSSHVSGEIDKLGPNLVDVVPADASLFCPKFARLSDAQRKQYWVFFISSMVRFESNFKTATKYTEGFNDANGKAVVSRGLLQISIESANSYGCGFRNAEELHDPLKNLSCGVRILNRWLGRDGRIGGKIDNQWRGGARYWSVLRAGDKTSYNSIVSWSQNLSICK